MTVFVAPAGFLPLQIARARRLAHRACGLQVHDLLAQGGGGRQAEEEVAIVGAAPVDDLRPTIVTVGADQDGQRVA